MPQQQQLSIQWVQEKIGGLYMANLQMGEELQRLTAENETLKKEINQLKKGINET
jgi:cell division protein FtsB